MSEEDDQRPEDAKELLRRAEQTQRNIDFIARQQAQFAANMQRLRDTQARNDEKWARTEEDIRALLSKVRRRNGM